MECDGCECTCTCDQDMLEEVNVALFELVSKGLVTAELGIDGQMRYRVTDA
jgi:hypothetical protein